MKLYIVSSDTWTESRGSEICIMGVFDNKKMAQKCFKKYDEKYYTTIDKVILNKDKLVYLGGYIA